MALLSGMARGRVHPVVTGMLGAALALTPAIPASAQPAETGDAIVLYSAGLEAVLPDEKDAPLREALSMLDARLVELPREIEGFGAPPGAIEIALSVLRSPTTARIALGDPESGPPARVSAVARPADIKAANELVNRTMGLARMMRMELVPAERAGLFRVEGPPVPIYIGTADGGGLFVGVMRTDEPAPLAVSALPAGVEPALAARVDFPAMEAMLESQLTRDDDGFARQFLMSLGLLGDDATVIDLAMGYDATRMHAVCRASGYARRARSMGMAPEITLGREFLSLIPKDATRVSAGTFDLSGLLDFAARMSGAVEDVDLETSFKEATGLDLRADVVGAFGNRFAFYQSETTGGGWIASSVALVEIADEAALERVVTRIVEASGELDEDVPLRRYVRIHEWSMGERAARTLTFPGLPVPLEVSWTIEDGLLIGAMSPNGLREALALRGKERRSILDDARFVEMSGGDPGSLIGLSYVDVPTLAPRGYGLVSVGVSALRNAARSPWDPGRQPTARVPTYHEFVTDVQPMVSTVRVEGDDIVSRVQGDRSALVNAAGMAGTASSTPMTFATISMLVGILLPALQSARENAQQIASAAMVRSVVQAAMVYAMEHEDRLPETLDDVRPQLGGAQMTSPYGPAPDGRDFAIRGGLGTLADVDRWDATILAVDRAMLFTDADVVNVGFVDGSVRSLSIGEFEALLQEPQNAGAGDALDLPEWIWR